MVRQRTRHLFMNTKQKILTYIAVVAIALTSLFAAWDLTGSPNHTNVTRYAPIFAPPDLSWWAKRELASSVLWTWLVIAVMYALMFVAFREPSAPTRRTVRGAFPVLAAAGSSRGTTPQEPPMEGTGDDEKV